jgi:hypothetical protein
MENKKEKVMIKRNDPLRLNRVSLKEQCHESSDPRFLNINHLYIGS